jgi:hypothetical protein
MGQSQGFVGLWLAALCLCDTSRREPENLMKYGSWVVTLSSLDVLAWLWKLSSMVCVSKVNYKLPIGKKSQLAFCCEVLDLDVD